MLHGLVLRCHAHGVGEVVVDQCRIVVGLITFRHLHLSGSVCCLDTSEVVWLDDQVLLRILGIDDLGLSVAIVHLLN